ncbi:ATP-binding protein [Streptomyces sp. ME18-1-4]|uniref:ATP-binding protein n=1 Tax=Streptomyces sp. ME18-1-4 TaxID=3028685 RepID=UPI0029AD2ECD|nr:ATP-binding protein [Streptomyces sp. ME18-1-4]MDX3242498.1 ATP-binding protein [Streptomyces sp. ME18-1-4]
MSERIQVAPRIGCHSPCPQDASRVGAMRRIAAAKLRYCGLDVLIDEVMLIVSELLTNAVLHSGSREITLTLRLSDGALHIAVIDGMPGHARRRNVDDDAEAGRGLALVEALVKENGGEWGTRSVGAETWCSLVVPREQP